MPISEFYRAQTVRFMLGIVERLNNTEMQAVLAVRAVSTAGLESAIPNWELLAEEAQNHSLYLVLHTEELDGRTCYNAIVSRKADLSKEELESCIQPSQPTDGTA